MAMTQTPGHSGEDARQLKSRASKILSRLKKTYPDAHCELDHATPLQLLVATILSAQCTDVRVNQVTPALFSAFPDARSLAGAPISRLEELIRTTGFFRSKAAHIKACCERIEQEHGGEVPGEMEALVKLSGVGRKTANVVLGNAFGINEGVVVDTHVARLSQRFGLSRHQDPVKTERVLMELFAKKDWALLSHLLIFHGRRRCQARKPDCAGCELAKLCPSCQE